MKKAFFDPTIKFFIIIIGLVVLFGVLKELQFIIVPLVIAYLLVFVFEPLNIFLIKKKIPQSIATLIDILIIIAFFWALSTFIIDSFSRLGEELPLYQQKLDKIVRTTALSFGIDDPFFTEFNIAQILSDLDYGGIASGLFSSTISIFSAGFFVLFFFVFVSSSHKHIIAAIKDRYIKSQAKISRKTLKKKIEDPQELNDKDRFEIIKNERERRVEKTFKDITEQIQRYIATKFLISLLTGFLVGIVLWIFDVDFLIVWAVMAFFLNFIPNIGSILAVVLPTVMTLIQYESVGYTFLVGGIISLVQNLIGNLLEPKIMGDKLGLNPLVILVSLLVWGYIWGIAGMFLSVPLTAVVKIIISNSNSPNLQFLSELMGASKQTVEV
jgi:predicted PurR-regulated permease PerM